MQCVWQANLAGERFNEEEQAEIHTRYSQLSVAALNDDKKLEEQGMNCMRKIKEDREVLDEPVCFHPSYTCFEA